MAVISNKQPQGKFVFKKQNKIRWKKSPSPGDEVVSSSPFFVTGSWDDMVRIKHAIMGINGGLAGERTPALQRTPLQLFKIVQ